MARFFRKPSINDHLDDLFGSWFGKGGAPEHQHKEQPAESGWPGIPQGDHHHDHGHGQPGPFVHHIVKYWLHKIFGGHHHNPPPPPDGNDAPNILFAEQTGQVPEGDSTELLTLTGAIKFIDKDFGDTHTATAEFVSTTHASGMEYGGLEALVNPNVAGGVIATATPGTNWSSSLKTAQWSYAVNDADIQHLAEGETVLQTYRVTVMDAAGEQDSRLVTIRLQGSNDAPTASAVALVVDANPSAGLQTLSLDTGPLAIADFDATDVDSDDDRGTLTYEILGQASAATAITSAGTIINNNDGTFSFDPGHDFDDLAEGETRDVTFTYRAVDRHGAASNEASITITVRGTAHVNEAPVVADQSFAVPEESEAGAAIGIVLATDPDSTDLSYAIVGGNEAGLFEIDAATGAIRLARGVDDPEVGSYALQVAVSDGDNTTTATATVEVTPVNDAPVAADGAATTAEDAVLAGSLPAATDAENDNVAYALGRQALNGTVIVNADGSYSYTPNPDFNGADSFSYVVSDGNGGAHEYEFAVTVTPVDEVQALPDSNSADPVIEAGVDAATGAPVGDATATGNALDNDTGQGVTVVGVASGIATGPQSGGVGAAVAGTYGALTLGADGQWTYTLDDGNAATEALAPGQTAHDVFSYTIAGENGDTSTTSLIVAITGSADAAAPVPPRAVADINIDDAVIEAGTQPDGTPIPGDSTAQGNAIANDEGQGLIVAGVAAGPLGATPGTGVGATIQGTYGTLTLGEDGQWSYQLSDTNPATDALGQGQQATDVFSYTIQNAAGQTSTAQLFVVISGSNDEVIVVNTPPTANPDTNDGDAVIEAGINASGDPTSGDPTATGNVLANDADPDIATGDVLSVVGVVAGVTTGDQTGGIPTDPINGVYGTLSINKQGQWTYALDNDRPATEALAQGQQATEVFTYTIGDEAGALSTTTLSIVITGTADAAANQAPDAVDDVVTATSATQPLTVNVLDNDSDPDGDPLILSIVTGSVPTGVIADLVDSDGDTVLDSIQLTPIAGGSFPDQFTLQYQIDDGRGGTDVATVTVTVDGGSNTPPTVSLTPVLTSLPEDTDTLATSIKVADILITDDGVGDNQLRIVGPDATLFEIVQTPDGPELHLREGAILSFQDNPILDVAVEVDDPAIGTGPEDSAPLSLPVTEANGGNLAPVADDDSASGPAGAQILVNVLDGDEDPDGTIDPTSVAIVDADGPDGKVKTVDGEGQWVVQADGRIAFAPIGGFTGPVGAIQYTVADNEGLRSNPATVTVTIDGGGMATISAPASAATDEDTVLVFSTTAPIAIQGVDPAIELRLTITALNGEVSINPNLDTDADGIPDVNDPDDDGDGEQDTEADFGPSITIVGTAAEINAQLAGMTYTPSANYNGPESLTYDLTDADGAPLASTAIDVTVNPVNDLPIGQPTVTGAAQQGAELVADPSTFSDAEGIVGPIAWQWQFSADGTGSVWDDIPGATSGTYTPASGDVGFQLRVVGTYTDGGGTVETVISEPTDQVVSGMSQAPVLSGIDATPLDYTENDGPAAIAGLVTITDPDSGDISAATVSIADYVEGEDVLSFTPQGGVTGSFNSTTGELTLAGPSGTSVPLVVFQAVLRSVTYENISDNPTDATRTLSFTVTDLDGNTSDASMREITVNPVNDLPIGQPTVTGAPQQGAELVADPSTFSDAEGIVGPIAWQWQFSADGTDWLDIPGATGSSFTPGPGQVGLQLRVVATYTDGGNTMETVGSDPTDQIVGTSASATRLVFQAYERTVGQELWISDGTDAGTVLVKDINPGNGSSGPNEFTLLDNKLIFRANNGTNGTELWVTDGTEAGTQLLKDINPGNGSSSPNDFALLNGKLVFEANDGSNGNELWVTDGTTGGTVLLKDINPGNGSSSPNDFALVNGRLIFEANDGTNGTELWVTDGTTGGTVLLKDINPNGNSSPNEFTLLNGRLIFEATDGSNGNELWVTDGTTDGTVLLKDIYPGNGASSPSQFALLDGRLIFAANDGSNGTELWVTDGTVDGTVLLKDINPNGASSPSQFTLLNGRLIFTANDGTNGNELWVTDGTVDGTVLLKDINLAGGSSPNEFTLLDGRLIFAANDGTTGTELWVTDGTVDGTMQLADINPNGNSFPTQFELVGGKLYFRADDGLHGPELWVTDGTPAGTTLVKSLNTSTSYSDPYGFAPLGDKVLFQANDGTHGYELWATDGTAEGTVLVKDIREGSGSSSLFGLTPLNGKLLFTADDGITGRELWVTDGTADGTVRLADINPNGSSTPTDFTLLNGRLVFRADDGTTGNELWATDGTPEGTVQLADINPNGSSNPNEFTLLGNKLIFEANDGTNGSELWVTDGTTTGTVQLADINPNGNSNPSGFTLLGNRLVFAADDGTTGRELWVTDGTPEGTVQLADVNPNGGSSPNEFTLLGDKLIFEANDGTTGTELWVTDGTPEGTVLLADINPNGSSNPNTFTLLGDKLIFEANDGTNGNELWVTDGTPEGTVLLKDIREGGIGSNPFDLVTLNDKVYFTANDGINGYELWVSDGTPEGTLLLKDIAPGPEYGDPYGLTVVGDKLYFSAYTEGEDYELWVSDGTAEGTRLVRDINSIQDGSSPAQLTAFNPLNDAPSGTDATINIVGETPHIFTIADFRFSDPYDSPADAFSAVVIGALPLMGLLTLAGTPVAMGDVIGTGDIDAGNLVFTPEPGNGTYTLDFQVQDNGGTVNGGVDLDPTPNTFTINVTVPNQAPVLAGVETSILTYTENDAATAVAPALTVVDADGDNIVSATVAIGGFVAGQDFLELASPPTGIVASFDAQAGVLTLTGSASLAEYEQALQSVAYQNSSDNPDSSPRTLSFTVNDGQLDSNSVAREIVVTPVNDAPVAEAQAAVSYDGEIVSGQLVASDVDGDDVTYALVAGSETNGTASIDSGGAFTFVPGPGFLGQASFRFVANDATVDSAEQTVTVTVAAAELIVNTLADEAYDGGSYADEIADGALSLREAIGLVNAGLVNSSDITFDQSIAGGQIDIVGDLRISADMTIDGGAAGMTIASDGTDRVFTINGNGASISASLNALTITGGGGISSGGGVRVLDGAQILISNSLIVGNAANNYGDAVDVMAGAAATLTNTTVTGNLGSGGFGIESSGDLTLINSTISGHSNGVHASTGQLTLTNSIVLGNALDDIKINGTGGVVVTYNGLNIVDEGGDGDPSDGVINGNPAAIFAALDPATGGGLLAENGGPTRTIALLSNPSNPALDGAIGGTDTDQRGENAYDAVPVTGDTGNNRDIGAYELNLGAAPVLGGIETTPLAFIENEGPAAVAGLMTISDSDSTEISSATVSIAGYVPGEDVLSFTPEAGIIGSYDATTGTLTLTGSASLAEYEQALQSVTYENSSDNPNSSPRTLSFTVNDGQLDSNSVAREIVVTPVNDAPAIGGIDATPLAYTENDGPAAVAGMITLTDPDSGDAIAATVSIAGYVEGEDVLSFTPQGGATGSFNSTTGELTISAVPTVPLVVFQAMLRSVTYENISDNPSGDTRTLSFSVTDREGSTSAAVTRDITVAPVNDAPMVADQSFAIDEGSNDGAIVGAILATDLEGEALRFIPSGDTGPFIIDVDSGQISLAQAVDDAEVGSYTFTVDVMDPSGETTPAQVTVTVNAVNDDPAGAPVVNGAAQAGLELTADVAMITDAHGIPDLDGDGTQNALDFTFQWEASPDGTVWTAIPAANGSTFTPGSAQVGQQIRVVVSYVDGQGFDESLTSDPTTAVVGLAVNTLADEAYDGGTLAAELADGGGLSLREAVGLVNAGLVSSSDITFDQSIAGGQITVAGGLTLAADMTIDGGSAGMTIASDGTNRVLTIDGDTTDISVSLNALTITGGGGATLNRGGGVRVTDGDEAVITNSLIVDNFSRNFGAGIGVDAGGAATLINTTVTGNAGAGAYAVESEGDLTMINSTVTGNALGVAIRGGSATATNSIVLGNGGAADFISSAPPGTVTFTGLSIIGEGPDTDPSDGKIDGNPVQVFAAIDPATQGGLLADNGGPTQTVALRDDPSNPALDGAIGGTDTDQRGESAYDAVPGAGDTGNNRDIGAYELRSGIEAVPPGTGGEAPPLPGDPGDLPPVGTPPVEGPPVVTPPVEGPPVATPPDLPPIANPNEPVAGGGALPPISNPNEPVAGGGIPAPSPIASGPSTTLTGTPESDHFVYHLGDGPVTIVDFDPGPIGTIVDQIELAGFGVDFGTLDTDGNQRLDQMDIGINGDATSITLDLGNGDTLTVANVTTLMEDDLLFS